MSKPPRRFKTDEELSVDEHRQRQEANRRNEPTPKFETDDYRARRAEVLQRKGLADEHDD